MTENTNNTYPPFTLLDVRNVSELAEAAHKSYKVRFSLDEGDNIVEAVARGFTNEDGTHFNYSSDVREAHLWMSGFVERFMPVSQILALMDKGMFAVDKP